MSCAPVRVGTSGEYEPAGSSAASLARSGAGAHRFGCGRLLVRELAALLLVELFARHRVDQRREPGAPQQLAAPVYACKCIN